MHEVHRVHKVHGVQRVHSKHAPRARGREILEPCESSLFPVILTQQSPKAGVFVDSHDLVNGSASVSLLKIPRIRIARKLAKRE